MDTLVSLDNSQYSLRIQIMPNSKRTELTHRTFTTEGSAVGLADILNLAIAFFALLVALVNVAYTIYSNKANLRRDGLQRIRIVATTNVARFNGIFVSLLHKPEPKPEDLIEPARLYSEVRDVYMSFKHCFAARNRIQLDALLDDIESSYDSDDLASGLASAIKKMPAFLNELEAKLNG